MDLFSTVSFLLIKAACRIFGENNNGKRIYHKHFDIFFTAPIINWPIPLFVVGLSRHVKDASSLLVDKKLSLGDVKSVKSNVIHVSSVSISLQKRTFHQPSRDIFFKKKKMSQSLR